MPVSKPADLVLLLNIVKNVKDLRLFIHTQIVGPTDAGCRNTRQRNVNFFLLHDSFPRELWIEPVSAAYTWSALGYRRSLSLRNQILYPEQHRCFACFSLENHPPKAVLHRSIFTETGQTQGSSTMLMRCADSKLRRCLGSSPSAASSARWTRLPQALLSGLLWQLPSWSA